MKTLSSSTAQDVLSKFLYADCRYLLLSISTHLRLGPILYSESTVSLIHKKNKNYELYFTKMTVTTVTSTSMKCKLFVQKTKLHHYQ